MLWFPIGAAGIAAAAEGTARLYHRRRYLIPFHSKAIGEYPFADFVEGADAPLFFRFKENFRSPMLNLNRFGARGPEPAPDGTRRRLMAVGESGFFGAKLRREPDLWSVQLERLLAANGYRDWEVINASVPGYNVVQSRLRYEALVDRVKPEILLLSIGGNDISQAFVMGDKWRPGAPWSFEFINRLQRKSTRWQKIGAHFCLYFLLRRQTMTARKGFSGGGAEPDWTACIDHNFSVSRQIVGDARSRGIKVALSGLGPAYSLNPTPDDARRLDAIQSNWRENLTGAGAHMITYFQRFTGDFARAVGATGIDLTEPFWNHPRRCEMFHDVFHWNPAGHRLTAESICRRLDDEGFWA